jgi:hypothetical protein
LADSSGELIGAGWDAVEPVMRAARIGPRSYAIKRHGELASERCGSTCDVRMTGPVGRHRCHVDDLAIGRGLGNGAVLSG